MHPNEMINNIAQLRWACRRGMLELDVLLNHFLDEAYAQIDPQDKHLFVQLLQCTDPELFAWLLGSEIPEDQGLAKIVKMIRQHARSRF